MQPGSGPRRLRAHHLFWGALAFVFLALEVYSPALRGPFLFDDFGLPFYSREFAAQPLAAWIRGVRPLLMLSYWANFQLFGYAPLSYHVANVVLHAVNALLAGLLVRTLLAPAGTAPSWIAPSFAALLFLLHPLQTESVAYIAGRSESLSALFALAALLVFFRAPADGIPARKAALVLLLYGCAVAAKEHAAVLPAALLAGDAILNRRSLVDSLRRHWRLAVPMAALGAVGLVAIATLLAGSKTAGFAVPGITPPDYLWTQARVWYLYLALFFLPVSQNADYDIPLSRGPFDYGAGLALAGLGAMLVAAWRIRRRWPAVSAGAFLFAILLAPTSSFVPIQDLAAERRLYLPTLGLLLMVANAVRRLRRGAVESGLLAGAVLICAILTYQRAQVWGDDVLLWSDIVRKAPDKLRGYTHLTFAYVRAGRCAEAVTRIGSYPLRLHTSPEFLGAWGAALECAGHPEDAIDQYRRAALIAPGVGTYLKLAIAYQRTGHAADAELLASQALRMQPLSPFDRWTLNYYRNLQERSRSRTP